mgnify:FL=1
MDSETASIMVAAGAITVFLMPLLAQVAYNVADRHPVDALREISHNPRQTRAILSRHIHEKRNIEDTDYRDVYLPKQEFSLLDHAKQTAKEDDTK